MAQIEPIDTSTLGPVRISHLKKYTVIWGDLGDSSFTRLDHIEAIVDDFKSIMDACIDQFEQEILRIDPGCEAVDRENTPYDIYAIFEGHIYEAPIIR